MPVLILCSLIDKETQGFLQTEAALIRELIAAPGLGEDCQRHTLRLKEFPDPAQAGKVKAFARVLMATYGLEKQAFETRFLDRDGVSFLAIHTPVKEPVKFPPALLERASRLWSWLRTRWQIPATAAGGLLLLAALYFGTGWILTRVVHAEYVNRDCQAVLKLGQPLRSLYPASVAPFINPSNGQVQECDTYLGAVQDQEAKNWSAAVKGYEAYLKQYPRGIYAAEAAEQAAQTLLAWAGIDHQAGRHQAAAAHLNLLLAKYSKSGSAGDAKLLLPECYIEWGRELRTAKDFLESQKVFEEFQAWAGRSGSADDRYNADMELAWLYVDWARDLFVWDEFEWAVTTYEWAEDLDPQSTSAAGPAALARQELPPARMAWGKVLIDQKNYEAAIDQFEKAFVRLSPEDQPAAQDLIARANARWAVTLADAGEFWDALEKLDRADEKVVTDTVLEEAANARTLTLEKFSNSSGDEARKLMSDTADALVEKAGKPILPIFGVNTARVRVYVLTDGVSASVASEFLPKTPGEMHFVAYITEEERVIQSCNYYFNNGYGSYAGTIKRHRYYWKIKLYNTATGRVVSTKEIAGSEPEACPWSTSGISDRWGGRPAISALETWLRTLIK